MCFKRSAGNPQQLEQIADGVKQLLTDTAWEHKIGGLMAAKVGTACTLPSLYSILKVTQALIVWHQLQNHKQRLSEVVDSLH